MPPRPRTSWRDVALAPPQHAMVAPTSDPEVSVLYEWGTLQFTVWPLNIHEVDHETDTDWAQKEIAGSAIFREWVGENNESLYLRGKIFPYRVGGMSELELLEAARRRGMAQAMIRGGRTTGTHLGWYVVEKLVRTHTFLSAEGVGQQIAFEAIFTRVPVPDDPANQYRQLFDGGFLAAG